MRCCDCSYCGFVEFDGYYCDKIRAFIPEHLVDKDVDCMIRDCDDVFTMVVVNSDGCKDVKSYLTVKMEGFMNE